MAPVFSLLSTFTLFTALATSVVANPSAGANHVRRQDPSTEELVPFLDYEAIKQAADAALTEDLERRGLVEPGTAAKKRSLLPTCPRVSVRKEWRKLTKAEKRAYIKATKCLQSKPDYGISPISDKMYDAFVYIHENNWFGFHATASFPVWHRWFVWLREVTLREQCGYSGPTPYWNYTMDYKDLFASPFFTEPETGFGTHGTVPYEAMTGATGYKVDNGAFANLFVNLPEPHYLTRNFTLWKDSDPNQQYGKAFGNWVSPQQVQTTLAAQTFWDFEKVLDGIGAPMSLGVHNTVHFNNNGDWYGPGWLANTKYFPFASTAPNDPAFFPHHAYVDAVFWKWQQAPGHQYDYGGSTNISDPTQNDAKITDLLPFSGFGPDIPVALTLRTEAFPLCYTYSF
ncbi:SubName: Full=Uncharacterized protein {ECO:0000313/EMBL:CCA75426.1} [Serendipita indica DSM 11827]|uniref:Tyrosinase copper-binding domain-containing protein n=1 Tax=Serendipita indica (strain DSM 11827) TaxID=1109443 RepID=G4TVT3_SERID|nr:SubName: Full=Uncharacterized protein {ECO:0000313/EMBL:CCA75426.1} [Serendipita indica DSM 11827]CCA75426.1 hypothetical protein PIIN_09409 [Serendipita indica DSM 11827]